MEEFKTICKNSTAELIEKKSKFISNVFYIQSEKEAISIINKIKQEYADATHNCYAYTVIDKKNVISKFSDDGEPASTAGAPILSVITKNGLINVLIIVTRYFGGILLGAGGLVKAYTKTAVLGLQNTTFISKTKGFNINLDINYKDLDKFKYYCKNNNIIIKNIKYLDNIKIEIELSKELEKNLTTNCNKMGIKILNYDITSENYTNKI